MWVCPHQTYLQTSEVFEFGLFNRWKLCLLDSGVTNNRTMMPEVQLLF